MKTAVRKRKWYLGGPVPMRVIKKFARDVVERFHPEKIVLFGSQAYGTPNEDSDVDIMVVMQARNTLDMAAKISIDIDPPFSLDIIVRRPRKLAGYLERGQSFHTEVMKKGKVLYDRGHS
ncbi:MAG: nucleotidyltransferase domain-containing protein [Gemmatales bacterium]